METGLLRVILSKIEEFYPAAAYSNSNELVENYLYYLLHSVCVYFNVILPICIEVHRQKYLKLKYTIYIVIDMSDGEYDFRTNHLSFNSVLYWKLLPTGNQMYFIQIFLFCVTFQAILYRQTIHRLRDESNWLFLSFVTHYIYNVHW